MCAPKQTRILHLKLPHYSPMDANFYVIKMKQNYLHTFFFVDVGPRGLCWLRHYTKGDTKSVSLALLCMYLNSVPSYS